MEPNSQGPANKPLRSGGQEAAPSLLKLPPHQQAQIPSARPTLSGLTASHPSSQALSELASSGSSWIGILCSSSTLTGTQDQTPLPLSAVGFSAKLCLQVAYPPHICPSQCCPGP